MAEYASAFPDPPTLYKKYSEESQEWTRRWAKVARDDTLEAAEADERCNAVIEEAQAQGIPTDLFPPLPPSEGWWEAFGQIKSKEVKTQDLESFGIRQLYDTQNDVAQELVHCLKSLLANYLELLSKLVYSQDQAHQKLEDIRLILINMHHLINTWRPHQATETLLNMIQVQITEKRSCTAKISEQIKALQNAI